MTVRVVGARAGPARQDADADRDVEEEAEQRKEGNQEQERAHVTPGVVGRSSYGWLGRASSRVLAGCSGQRDAARTWAVRPARRSSAWGSSGSSASRPLRTAPGLPGRLTIRQPPTTPALPRDSAANGVSAAARARRCSAIPGASRSTTSSVASGVTSRGARPVPPVVSTSCEPTAARRSAAAIACGRRSRPPGRSPRTPPARAAGRPRDPRGPRAAAPRRSR